MKQILFNDWIFIPLVAFIVFYCSYRWSNQILAFFHKKTLGQREEIVKKLDLMFVDVNPLRLTILLLLSSFGLSFVIFLLLWPKIGFGLFLSSVILIISWTIPTRLVNMVYDKRCSRFVDQMIDGMTIMSNGIKSGLSIPQAMERVVENLTNPIRQEFSLVLSQMRIGRSLEEALIELGERIPKPDVQMFVTAVNILKETGGNLAETFETITSTIRERQKIQKKIEALTAQGMMQGVIITAVPFILLIVFMVIDPGYVKPLFTTTFGFICLFIMLGLQIIGGIMIRKIVKIEV